MRLLALAAALVAAAVVPGAPPGIGVVAVALLVGAAAATAAPRTVDLLLFGPAAVVLGSFPAILDADWVVALDLAAAWAFATLAVNGPEVRAAVAPVIALGGAPALIPEPSERTAPAIRAAGFATALVVPFAVLFLTADAAFASLADSAPRPDLSSLPTRAVVFSCVLLASVGLALSANRPRSERGTRSRTLSVVEWAVPLAVLDALFVAFVAVQVTVLFGGHDHVLETTGLTYAEYAREGFWQLLAAATLTLLVVRGARLVAEVRTTAHRLLLHALLGLLCALTIVVVVSALHRLRLYESTFGLTRLRLSAEAFALWLGGLFALVLAAGALRRTAWLAQVAAAWTAAALTAFSLANPDGRIAERNVDRWRSEGDIDVGYLAGLSADAVPALLELPRDLSWPTHQIALELAEPEPWTSANLSRRRARALLERDRAG